MDNIHVVDVYKNIYLSFTAVAKSNGREGLKSHIVWKFHGAELQGSQLVSLLESHKAEIKALTGLLSLLEAPKNNLLPTSPRRQTGFSMCRIRVPAALFTAVWTSSISKHLRTHAAH